MVLILHPLNAFKAYGKCNYDYIKKEVEKVWAFGTMQGTLGLDSKSPIMEKVGAFPCCSFNIRKRAGCQKHVCKGP